MRGMSGQSGTVTRGTRPSTRGNYDWIPCCSAAGFSTIGAASATTGSDCGATGGTVLAAALLIAFFAGAFLAGAFFEAPFLTGAFFAAFLAGAFLEAFFTGFAAFFADFAAFFLVAIPCIPHVK